MLKTNIKIIDDLLDKGLENGSLVFLFGQPNSGKSLLAFQIGCQYRSLIINTEPGSPDEFGNFLKKRYGENYHSPTVLNKRSLFSLGRALGLNIQLVSKSREGEKEEIKTTKLSKAECEVSDAEKFPVLDYLKQNKSEIFILDSLTTPIKGAIGSARQNFGARANVFARIMGQISLIIDELDIVTLVTAHQTRDATNKYDLGRIWGGDSLGYYAKYILQLSASQFKVDTDDAILSKNIRRRRYLGKLETKYKTLPIKKDFGFV